MDGQRLDILEEKAEVQQEVGILPIDYGGDAL
jgi:hypothetical protein